MFIISAGLRLLELALARATQGLDVPPGEAVLIDARAVFTDREEVGWPDAKIDRRDGGSNCEDPEADSPSVETSNPPEGALRGALACERETDGEGDDIGLRDWLLAAVGDV